MNKKEEKIKKLNKKNHKKLTLLERAEILVYNENNIHKHLGEPKEGNWTTKFLLSNKCNKKHVSYYRLHFDEYYCPGCFRTFKSMWEISEDWGMPICGKQIGIDDAKMPIECWTMPQLMPKTKEEEIKIICYKDKKVSFKILKALVKEIDRRIKNETNRNARKTLRI